MDYIQLLRIMLDDTTQEDLARDLGTTQATISRWLSGQEPRGSAIERIRALARSRRLANSSITSETMADEHLGTDDIAERAKPSGFSDSGFFDGDLTRPLHAPKRGQNKPRHTASKSDSTRNTVHEGGDIANFTIHAGMGNGGTLSVQVDEDGMAIDPSDSDGFWSFPEQVKAGWREMTKTYAMPVTGDSMEPTLTNGSYVFVDTSHNYPSPPDLYAVNYGHGLMIKRLELLPEDCVNVISDNERYSDFEFHASEVEVYGRVVASFQWRG
jgi:phage repressor protein C with HTH and peptisase S24 domain